MHHSNIDREGRSLLINRTTRLSLNLPFRSIRSSVQFHWQVVIKYHTVSATFCCNRNWLIPEVAIYPHENIILRSHNIFNCRRLQRLCNSFNIISQASIANHPRVILSKQHSFSVHETFFEISAILQRTICVIHFSRSVRLVVPETAIDQLHWILVHGIKNSPSMHFAIRIHLSLVQHMLVQLELSSLHLSILKLTREGVSWIHVQRSPNIFVILEPTLVNQLIKHIIGIDSSSFLTLIAIYETDKHANLLGRNNRLLVELNETTSRFRELSTHLSLFLVIASHNLHSIPPSSLFNFPVLEVEFSITMSFSIHIFTFKHFHIFATFFHLVSVPIILNLIIYISPVYLHTLFIHHPNNFRLGFSDKEPSISLLSFTNTVVVTICARSLPVYEFSLRIYTFFSWTFTRVYPINR